ncbi:ABC transporter permease [Terriglobus albidus]|uniref:Autoinducer 2 import system permease protein LsrC n=1 Tax=Terriglobus albidus TaxID=1592106 RepID=A0A5B9EF31_9BACT|nr:ABC transporter permease [Terriglobus albidus]QEE28666.1 ABC transporter permease [Terriglobus albidus]
MKAHARELAVAATILLVLALLAATTHGFFTVDNLSDLFLANVPVLIVSLGMTLIILTGQIDISVGSVFAVCSIVTGVAARAGLPVLVAMLIASVVGAFLGSFNGTLVAWMRMPSIVVTLASMVTIRDGLRWQTQGAWVGDLPGSFQRFGLSQTAYTILMLMIAVLLVVVFTVGLRYFRGGRNIFATGSNEAAARILGIDTNRVLFSVFAITGLLTGFSAALNAVRFNQIPSNSGIGLELKTIAAVAVGGATITGGSGTIAGTVLGVVLLGIIGPALTFLGVSAYWERAIQGLIILAAVSVNVLSHYRRRQVSHA